MNAKKYKLGYGRQKKKRYYREKRQKKKILRRKILISYLIYLSMNISKKLIFILEVKINFNNFNEYDYRNYEGDLSPY